MATLRKSILAAAFVMGIAPGLAQAASGKFTAADYQRALWMTTRFYGAQRDGKGPNWLLIGNANPVSFMKDSDGSLDLTGGWFDCGDNALFGQTFFYSAYSLAKAYDLFPTGFPDDYHGFDYSDYVASKNWDKTGGLPDGIPDLLQELKSATDWIIKATPDAQTFYSQLGDYDADHKVWCTSGYKSINYNAVDGGEKDQPRPKVKNPDDGAMPALAAAALALMSKHWRKYDASYADSCLSHAYNAYAYASSHKGLSKGSAAYSAWTPRPNIQFMVAASELYRVTNKSQYLSDFKTAESQLNDYGHGYTLNWNNPDDWVWFNGDLLGESFGANFPKLFANSYKNAGTGENGLSTIGDGWGFLRYPANQAFSCAAWAAHKGVADWDQFIYNQVDYILGENNAKQSFVVGFCSGCSKSPQYPHHRNVYLYDGNDMTKIPPIPDKNKQFGYLVGFTKAASNTFTESVGNYQQTEGGIDYNAGLVGALAYIVSKLAPVDTSKLGPTSLHPRTGTAFSFSANATGRTILLSSSAQLQEVLVTDPQGRVLAQTTPGTASYRWTAPASGLYLTRVRTASGWASSKVMVQE